MTTKKDREHVIARLQFAGITWDDVQRLRRIALTLHRWHELECGVDGGGIERDEVTGKVTWYSAATGARTPYPDRETPCLKRLDAIRAKYPGYGFYVQGDPRGASLYVITPHSMATVRERGLTLDICYSSYGVAVF